MLTFTLRRAHFYKKSNNSRAERFSTKIGQDGDRSDMFNSLYLLIHETGN